MSVFEDQIPKWENCLEPSDDIKASDRTFKLIKDRLLKAVIERSRRLQSVAGDDMDNDNVMIEIQPDLDGDWGEDANSEDLMNSFIKIRESKNQRKAGNQTKGSGAGRRD